MEKMNKVIPFDFNGNNVRVVKDEEGNPWFVGKDVCRILGIVWQGKNTLFSIPKIWKMSMEIPDSLQRKQYTIFISEAGLYKLTFRSNKPNAEKFMNWIASEVLPSIRKHGAYMTDKVIDDWINDPEVGIKLLTALKEERDKRKKAEFLVQEQNQLIGEMKPKVDFYEAIMNSDESFSAGTTAKILKIPGIGRNKLLQILREEKILMSNNENYNIPYQIYIDKEWFEVLIKPYRNGQIYAQTFVLPKGIEGIKNLLEE